MRNKYWIPQIVVLLAMAVLAGCSSGSKGGEAVLTFDGVTCQYEGPESITAGDMMITLDNQSEYDADFWIVRLDDDRTWQDMLDYIGAPGSNVHPPDWSDGTIIKGSVPDKPDTMKFQLTSGLYVINCCTCNEILGPKGVWPGAPLVVEGK